MRIIFSMPVSFIRTQARTNPFFDPIIKVCEKNGLDWKVLVPCSRSAMGYDAQHVIDGRAFELWGLWFWRLVRLFNRQAKPAHVYTVFGKIWRWVTLGRYRADLIISVAGQFAEQLEGVNPSARFADLQHGVIYSKHNGYFDGDRGLNELYRKMSNHEFWLYGQGYADCFFKNPENHKWLDGRVKVIGDVVRAGKPSTLNSQPSTINRNLIVFSLQLTNDLDAGEKAASVVAMEKFFGDFFAKFGDKYECYVKHHPRFNNCFDLSAFYQKFPQVKESKAPWPELYPKMALHVTFTSTVCFDCASAGVPTCLIYLPEAKIINCAYYRDDYAYPYYGKTAEEILAIPFEEASEKVHDWYLRFYAPFTEKNCLKLLKLLTGER